MIKSVLLFCLLVGLEVVYSEDGANVTVFQETKTITYNDDGRQESITYHTMTIPPQSFFVTPSQGGEGHRFVRDRSSPQPPTISFNNGDIQHIIEEMHFTPRHQEINNGNDFDLLATLFSIDPFDEDLGTAMKKNRHFETRLPVFFQPMPTLQAPSKKVIPQAPAQRKALVQSPLQQEFQALPSKPIEPSPTPMKQELEPVRSHKPDTQGKSKGWGWSNPLPLDMDEKELNSEEMFLDLFYDLLASFMKEPFELESRYVEEKKPADRVNGFESADNGRLKSLQADTPSGYALPASRKTVADSNPGRAVSTTPSDAMPKVTTQSAVRAPAKNVLYLDRMPEEFIRFIKSMDENEGLPQNMFFGPFFI